MSAEKQNCISIDVIVLGAGLCGLATALLLHEQGYNVHVLEARRTAGGRVRSVLSESKGEYLADLGPSWIWPAFQPVMQRWLDQLNLQVFPQYDSGQTVLDNGPGHPPGKGFYPSQDGIARLYNGPQSLIDAMLNRIPVCSVYLDTTAQSVSFGQRKVAVNSVNMTFSADRLVVTIPPRIAINTLEWGATISDDLRDALDKTPTWMAPHAKVVAIFKDAFWRDRGLSGRIISRSGPIVECHDHCSPDRSVAALWGFIGWPHDVRTRMASRLEPEIRQQLSRCFGPDSPEPVAVHIEDWSQDPFVASAQDLNGEMHHPSVGADILRQPHFDGRLFFAGSETAEQSPGLIEGAFDAAERVARTLQKLSQLLD